MDRLKEEHLGAALDPARIEAALNQSVQRIDQLITSAIQDPVNLLFVNVEAYANVFIYNSSGNGQPAGRLYVCFLPNHVVFMN